MSSSWLQMLVGGVVLLLLLQKTLVSTASIPVVSDFNDELDESGLRSQFPAKTKSSSMQKERLQGELAKQLFILRAAEQNILKHIQALEAERRALTHRKRSHFTSMCMFNVVACYRRRK